MELPLNIIRIATKQFMQFFKKIKKIKLIFSIVIIFIFIIFLLSRGWTFKKDQLEYGITFSKKQSQSLNLDWKENYIALLDDLKIRKLRLSAYWDEIESNEKNFQWQDLDWQIKEAGKRDVEIILAVGNRLPRWPECHLPLWVEKLDKNKREEKTLQYIEKIITRYKNNKNIIVWQVENEPFLSHFGECFDFDSNFLDKEIALVKKLDNRPIMITDSGELSIWIPATKRADIFGTTMYLDTYSEKLKSYIHYPIKPGFFKFKKNIARIFSNPKKWIVIELQTEPWGPEPFQNLSKEERDKTMNLKKFKEIIEFSHKAGFCEFYLWGAEWWYWELKVNNNPEIWNEAKKLF